MLDVRRLRYFVAIARCGSIAAASRELNVAQPSLSSLMSGLEEAIGVPLFLRFSRGVTLTKAGDMLLSHAQSILAALEAAESDMHAFAKRSAPRPVVTLALLPSWGTSLAPAIIAAMARQMPDIGLKIVELRNEEAVRALGRKDVDMAVVLGKSLRTPHRLIVREPLMLVSNRPIAASIPLAEVAGGTLILPSGVNQLRVVVDKAAASIGLKLQPVMEIDGQDTIKSAIEAGVGQSIMPWNSIKSDCAAGRLFASTITAPSLFRNVYLGSAEGTDKEIFGLFFVLLKHVALQSGSGDPPLPGRQA